MAKTRQLQDFVGFQFNGRHSSEFGLKIVSNSNRFQDNFGPTFKDNTVKVPGGDGNFYWNTEDDKKEWTLSVAFEDVSEIELRQMRQWLNSKAMGELIFDEEPYKAYRVKMKSPAQFKYLCFDKEIEGEEPYTSTLIHNHMLEPSQESETPAQSARNVERVYKGEGTIAFVAYQPYAESVYEDLDLYDSINYPNKDEWAAASGIPQTTSQIGISLGKIIGQWPPNTTTVSSITTVSLYFSTTSISTPLASYGGGTDRTVLSLDHYYDATFTSAGGTVNGYLFMTTGGNSSYNWTFTDNSIGKQTVGARLTKSHSVDVLPVIGVSPNASGTTDQRTQSNNLAKILTQQIHYTIYNPGDLDTDWTFRFLRPSTDTTVTIALWSGATQPDSVVEFTTSTDNFLDGQYIEISSRTQLIRVLNSDFTTTSFLLNTGLSRDGFFKIPVTTDPSKYSVQISGIDPSGSNVSFKYKYLYY